jgi:methionine-rich copper-binding protein CopC
VLLGGNTCGTDCIIGSKDNNNIIFAHNYPSVTSTRIKIESGTTTIHGDIVQVTDSNGSPPTSTSYITLVYGDMRQNNVTTTVALTSASTYYTLGGFTMNRANRTTLTSSSTMRLPAGTYKVSWKVAASVNTSNQTINATPTINGTAQTQCSDHMKQVNSADQISIGTSCVLPFTEGQTVGVALSNETSGGFTATVQHANVVAERIGN